MSLEQHADVLRLTADELAKLPDEAVGTPADSALLRAASDLTRAAALNIDAAVAHDGDPVLKASRKLITATVDVSEQIRPTPNQWVSRRQAGARRSERVGHRSRAVADRLSMSTVR